MSEDLPLLQSFWMGGFEGGSHRRRDGLQIDVLRSMRHDTHAAEDYGLLSKVGIRTVRDALRCTGLSERRDGMTGRRFCPCFALRMWTGTQVIWDLCQLGSRARYRHLLAGVHRKVARFAGAAARVVTDETDAVPIYAPMNEMSFWSWIGGDVGSFYPYHRGSGDRLKHQLVRAAIAAMDAVRAVDARARFLQPEPMIHIADNPAFPLEHEAVARYNESQYTVYDLLSGRLGECGGDPVYLDILGCQLLLE